MVQKNGEGDMEVDEIEGSEVEAEAEGNDSDSGDEYVVERVVKHKVKNGKIEYYIKWQGYDEIENTWEKEQDVFCTELIKEYWNSLKSKKPQKKETKTITRHTISPMIRTVQQKKKRRINADDIQADDSSDEEFPPRDWKSWEEYVEEVETVERDGETLLIYVNWSDGHRTVHPAEEANKMCPQKIIKFYETHLRFKNTGE